jgi:hypothetical protein
MFTEGLSGLAHLLIFKFTHYSFLAVIVDSDGVLCLTGARPALGPTPGMIGYGMVSSSVECVCSRVCGPRGESLRMLRRNVCCFFVSFRCLLASSSFCMLRLLCDDWCCFGVVVVVAVLFCSCSGNSEVVVISSYVVVVVAENIICDLPRFQRGLP